jgi:hypothetical protein
MLGVIATYKLIGNDQMKANNINIFLEFIEEMIAIQAGRHSMIKVLNIGSLSFSLE